jgi:tetratricopeptide (TPR) repeat protein
MQILDPTLSADEARATIEEFQSLPAVTQLSDSCALHDVIRKQLFEQWLTADRRTEFSAVSRRLATHFLPQANDNAVSRVAEQNTYVFHLLGADLAEGFETFQQTYDTRRKQGRFSDGEALLRLLTEYQSILGPRERAWLTYYEAEIATDRRDWTGALNRLEDLVAQNLPDDLKSKTLLALGAVLRQFCRFDDARLRCNEALQYAESARGSGASLQFIHDELGKIERDYGNFEEARRQFEQALELAKSEGDDGDRAVAYNSLGTLLLKPFPAEAAGMFEECLNLLDPERARERARVLNNLAIAKSNLGDWTSSLDFYQRSLQIKRNATDLYGQALTLMNMARVYQAQQDWDAARATLMESASLFETVHDTWNTALVHRELARLLQHSQSLTEVRNHALKAVEYFDRAADRDESQATRREFKRAISTESKWRRKWWIGVAVAGGVISFTLYAVMH